MYFLLTKVAGIWAFTCAVVFAQERYATSVDGQEVTDSKTGLTWKRCAEGMTFKRNICSGEALFLSQQDALARAQAAGAD